MENIAEAEGRRNSPMRYTLPFSASGFIQAPLLALLEYSGILRPNSNRPEGNRLVVGGFPLSELGPALVEGSSASAGSGDGEVSIRIIGAGDHEALLIRSNQMQPSAAGPGGEGDSCCGLADASDELISSISERLGGDGVRENGDREAASSVSPNIPASISALDGESMDNNDNVAGGSNLELSHQRDDIQRIARWVEHILPYSLLLLLVFIRQHLQGFVTAIWISIVMFKSNDILRKQTALKEERKVTVIVGFTLASIIHIFSIYWCYKEDGLLCSLRMVPPKETPTFWHAMFIIFVNDVMVHQEAMVLKSILLILSRTSKGHNYRKQGQMLTLVEYLQQLWRCLLPVPIWYRFFLNKAYGSLFSSLITGLYLTFKLTSIIEKVPLVAAALKALSQKVHYGCHATTEQVIAAGDLCAICQEKMHVPILLSCKHMFCEDCACEWFERERTCPLCRAVVKPQGLKSFSDGTTSLYFQFF